ncbi:MAG: hypothetical protein LBR17_03930 [Bacteroidales bacterium]|jgi:hypothetical protein|nr:hypothetical protein [Bacteroidales bacterium]
MLYNQIIIICNLIWLSKTWHLFGQNMACFRAKHGMFLGKRWHVFIKKMASFTHPYLITDEPNQVSDEPNLITDKPKQITGK